MATNKKANTTGKKSTSLVRWDEELAKFAQKGAAVVDGIGQGGNFISFKGGKITYKGGEVPGNKMNVVVVAHGLENSHYTGKYDPSNPAPPSCFALGMDPDAMVPHENSAEPCSERCKGCENNEWGSADTGRGKACKNLVRLAIISQSDLDGEEGLENVEVALVRVPVTSTKAWAGYVRNLQDVLQRPPFAVVTEISVIPDSDSQFKVLFKLVEPIEGEAIGELIRLQDKFEKDLLIPYQKAEAAPAPAKRAQAPKKARKF